MPYSKNFLRLVAIGTLHGVEDFSFSMSLINATTPTPEAPTEVPQGIIDAFIALWNQPLLATQACALTMIKLNEIGVDGRYVGDDTVFYEFVPPQVGDYSIQHAPQVALAVSLRSAVKRGRAHAGRFYFPAPAVTIGGNGKIQPIPQQELLLSMTTFLDAINTAMAPWQVGITSRVGLGEQRRAESVAVGAVLDTIRSRREKFEEAYLVADLAGGAAPVRRRG